MNEEILPPADDRDQRVREEMERHVRRAAEHYGTSDDAFEKKKQEVAEAKSREANDQVRIRADEKQSKAKGAEWNRSQREMKASIEHDQIRRREEEARKIEQKRVEQEKRKRESAYMDDLTEMGRLRTLKEYRKTQARQKRLEAEKQADLEAVSLIAAHEEQTRKLISTLETDMSAQLFALERMREEGLAHIRSQEDQLKSQAVTETNTDLLLIENQLKQRLIEERKEKRSRDAMSHVERQLRSEYERLASERKSAAQTGRMNAERRLREEMRDIESTFRASKTSLESTMRRKKADYDTQLRRQIADAKRVAREKKAKARDEESRTR